MRFAQVIALVIMFYNVALGQLSPNVTAFVGSWEVKIPKRSQPITFKLEIDGETQTGDCHVDIEEGWSFFLNENDGNLEGTVSNTYFRTAKATGTSGMLCFNIAQKNFLANYSVSLKRVGDKFEGLATPTNCMIGQCPGKPLRPVLTMDGDKLICAVDGGQKMELTRMPPPR